MEEKTAVQRYTHTHTKTLTTNLLKDESIYITHFYHHKLYMVSSGLVGHGLRLQILQKMPATDAGKTSGICNLRPWPTSPEDTIYSRINLSIKCQY